MKTTGTTNETNTSNSIPFSFRNSTEVWEEMIDEAKQLDQTADDPFDIMKTWLAPQYAAEVRQLLEETPGGQERFEIMRAFVVDWARLQTLHQASQKLKIVHSPAWRTQWLRQIAAALPPHPAKSE